MKSIGKITLIFVFILSFGRGITLEAGAHVVRAGDKVIIVDRMGERWDITQAASIGFEPRGFQFGIGRDSIRPLDASSLGDNVGAVDRQTRVIGVHSGPDAHAYVVRKLTRHEIANTRLGEVPIAAAY
jgi:NAD(P)-dependent dehydrogenase (short-subunit alcohol dehydrogenase family)